MENTLHSTKSVYISVINNMNLNIFDSFYLHYMGWIKPKNHITLLSLKGTVRPDEINLKVVS